MVTPTRTEAIKAFLTARAHPDLAALYYSGMECQVNVAQDGGQNITGEFKGKNWHGYTDGLETWKPIRIPWNANTEPTYEDSKMSYDLSKHAEGIGMTGWDWAKRLSRWVAFDFDAITGHTDAHAKKMTEEELNAVKDAAFKIPWVTVRKSTGGRGLHLYVFLEPVLTSNHNEHAALARAILGKMSALAGFDFGGRVDICGSNMWVWHRKILRTEGEGLKLLKKGEVLKADQVPPNWKDHYKVITGHRRKNLPRFIESESSTMTEAEMLFAELTGQTVHIPLDEEHKRLIKYLEDHATQSWWDNDYHMLVTHTYHLKQAHADLSLRGFFDTIAEGTEAGHDHNCFCFPLRRGAWAIRRYSIGVQEHESWSQDGQGWTRCHFNIEPDLGSAARAKGGIEAPNGGFVFQEASIAVDAARLLGVSVREVPPAIATRKATLKPHKDGRLIMQIEGDPQKVLSHTEMPGWLFDKGKWTKVFNMPAAATTKAESEGRSLDDLVRHIIGQDGSDHGWVLKRENAEWGTEPLTHIQTALEASGLNPKEVKNILGTSVIKCWTLVNLPFQAEYPGNKLWNRDGAQLRFVPSQEIDKLSYPTWKAVIDHCGAGLTDALQNHPWAKANGIKTGGDYLKIWIASMIKYPYEPLPYLFFYSAEQNTGKSTFHEAIELLMTRGYQRADKALINPQGFNAELQNALICVIEEIDLRKNRDANARIKDWVTARQLPIHPKGKTPYVIRNTTHWVQCANDANSCPVFPGDTRITMIQVEPIPPGDMIRKAELIPKLEKEASDFLAEILRLEIPPSNDRLNVPVVATAFKEELQKANRTPLEIFLDENTFLVPGVFVELGELYNRFFAWLQDKADTINDDNWTKVRMGKELPPQFPKGRNPKDNQVCVGNMSFSPPKENAPPLPKLKAEMRGKEAYLVPEK
jgi:hypothetical protein